MGLAVVMFSAAIVACSGENEKFDVDFEPDENIVQDFGGASCTIIGSERNGRIEVDPSGEYEDSYWAERLKERYGEIEKTYNVKFVFKRDDGNLVANFAAGLDWADLYDNRADNHYSYLNGGYLLPLNDFDGFLEGIEDGKWGSPAAVEYFSRHGLYYGFQAGYHGIPFPALGGMLYGNATVLNQFGVSPFEMIENGTWTWSGFEQVLSTIGCDPKNDDAVCGMLFHPSFPKYFMTAAIMSNGGDLAVVDSEGNYKINMDDPKCVEALEWVRSLITKGLAAVAVNESGYTSNTGAPYQFARFVDNRLAFWCEYSYVGTVDTNGFMYQDLDFYILPCPAGPSGNYGEWAAYIGQADRYFSVPATAHEDIVSTLLTKIYEPLGEDKYEWRDVYASLNFLHEESAHMYYTMYDNARPDYHLVTDSFPWGSISTGSKTVNTAVEENLSKMQANLDKYYNDISIAARQ